MHYLSSRNRRAVGLTGILSLTISLLPTVASPASAATDGSGTEDVSIEIVIKSDDEVTMTFLATTPSRGHDLVRSRNSNLQGSSHHTGVR